MAVGMSFKASLIVAEPLTLGLLVLGLLAVKLVVLYAVGRANGLADAPARALAAATAQGGEFAFVILGAAVTHGLLGQGFADRLIAVVTLSMAATPLLLILNDRLTSLLRGRQAQQPFDTLPGDRHPVIIAGFGRFGQMVGRILRAKGIGFTALEASPEQVDFVRQYGAKVYYGDAARLDLLQAARAQDAEIFVLAIDDVEASVRTAATVRKHFPHLAVYARARNRLHAYRLMELGITPVWRETFLSATDMAEAVLKGLGLPDYAAEKAVATFRAHDEQRLYGHFGAHNDEKRMQALAKKAAQELKELFQEDAARDETRP
jgi:voltage-gated potassium channel Kch